MASDGMTVTVNAEAADGYEFKRWQEDGETVSADIQYTFPVHGSRNLIAGFSMPQYEAGIDWWTASLPSPALWYGITYGGGKFVAVGGNKITAAYSRDGVVWTMLTLPSPDPYGSWSNLSCGDGKFVALAHGTSSSMSSKVAYSCSTGPGA